MQNCTSESRLFRSRSPPVYIKVKAAIFASLSLSHVCQYRCPADSIGHILRLTLMNTTNDSRQNRDIRNSSGLRVGDKGQENIDAAWRWQLYNTPGGQCTPFTLCFHSSSVCLWCWSAVTVRQRNSKPAILYWWLLLCLVYCWHCNLLWVTLENCSLPEKTRARCHWCFRTEEYNDCGLEPVHLLCINRGFVLEFSAGQ